MEKDIFSLTNNQLGYLLERYSGISYTMRDIKLHLVNHYKEVYNCELQEAKEKVYLEFGTGGNFDEYIIKFYENEGVPYSSCASVFDFRKENRLK